MAKFRVIYLRYFGFCSSPYVYIGRVEAPNLKSALIRICDKEGLSIAEKEYGRELTENEIIQGLQHQDQTALVSIMDEDTEEEYVECLNNGPKLYEWFMPAEEE